MPEQLKLYVCRTFKPKQPVGHGAAILASSKAQAALMLRSALNQPVLPSQIEEVPQDQPTIALLIDGDY